MELLRLLRAPNTKRSSRAVGSLLRPSVAHARVRSARLCRWAALKAKVGDSLSRRARLVFGVQAVSTWLTRAELRLHAPQEKPRWRRIGRQSKMCRFACGGAMTCDANGHERCNHERQHTHVWYRRRSCDYS